ncbi:hypothetical protein [Winogradskyella sp.]|uniref:hypothetical protein n=1 Tax=Winogradskyella sp. TaxID=1883156 RepID=UPI003AB4A161
MKKLLLSIVAVFFYTLGLFAQQGDFEPKLPDFVPPSPTAFSLGKYGDIPVNESTGMANINIPLYTFSTPNLSLPIGLSYTTSGVKVGQIASWVGMGWNLNAGGVITRNIRGLPDEDATRSFPSYSGLTSINTTQTYYDIIYNIANKTSYDYASDIYNFNIDGFSGSFFLDATMTPVLIKKEAELKIEIIGASIVNGFTITTPKGIKYTFSVSESTKQRMSCGSGNPGPNSYQITSWYLSKITHFLGDEITFEYDNSTNYLYTSSVTQTYGKNSVTQASAPSGATLPAEGVTKCATNTYVLGKSLTRITSNRGMGSVYFNTSLSRSDVNDYRLDGITIKNNNNEQIKQFEFNYSNIQSTVSYSGATSFPLVGSSSEQYRLFLNYVQEKDALGNSNNGKKYSFEYNSPSDLPRRLSLAQDELGYYNGAVNSSFLPSTYGGGLTVPGGTGNRTFSFSSATKGILNKVTYPTKGYTILEYESGPSAIRVKKIRSLAESGGQEKIIKYYYTTKETAVAGTSTSTGVPIGSGNYVTTTPTTISYQYLLWGNVQTAFYTFDRTEFTSSGALPISLTNANHYMYNTVTMGIGNNFEGGGIEKKFSVNSDAAGSILHGNAILKGGRSNTGLLNGTLLEESHFKKNGSSVSMQKKTVYSYYENPTHEKILDNYIGNIRYESPISSSGYNAVSGYDANRILLISKWIGLETATTTEYFSSGNIITTQTNNYGTTSSALAGLPIETSFVDSYGYTIKKQFVYPAPYTTLRNQNRFETLETKSLKGSTLLTHEKTLYDTFGSNYLPEYIQTVKGSQSLENRIRFHSYDNKGNPTEISKIDGTHIVYIWGYNQTRPIAKIDNITYAQISAYVSNLQTKSNADINATTEEALRTDLNAMRTALLSLYPTAQVTTFTYDPLIGVKSITDPRGKTVYYEYDPFSRLGFVMDDTGNILTSNEYNYKN